MYYLTDGPPRGFVCEELMVTTLTRRPANKPLVLVKSREARIKLEKEHLNRTPEQWSKVLWSDESKLMIFGSSGIRYISRPPGERFNPKFQLTVVKHGGGNIMVWALYSHRHA